MAPEQQPRMWTHLALLWAVLATSTVLAQGNSQQGGAGGGATEA